MNNIYKVIWSKAKNCYVVASEIARSHTKSASGSEKIGGGTRRKLLASLMALSLLCGGLGVASATLEVVNQNGATGTTTIYTKEEVDNALIAKGAATEVAANRTDIDNLKTAVGDAGRGLTKAVADQNADIAANKANITALQNELGNKADTTALNNKADRATTLTGYGITDAYTKDDVNNALKDKADTKTVNALVGHVGALETTVGNASKGLVKDVNELKAQGNTLNTALGNKADKADLDTANGKITNLQKKTEKLSDDGTELTGMTTVSGTTVSGDNVNADVLTVTRQISDGAGVTTTLAKINDSMTQTTTNKDDIATNKGDIATNKANIATNTAGINDLKTKTTNQQTAIDGLNEKTINITHDAAGTSVDGVTFNAGKVTGVTSINGIDIGDAQVDMKGKDLTGVGTINGINLGTVDAQVKTNAEAIAQEKTDREKAIGSLTEDKNYIKKANNVSDNLVELDKQAKTNADAIAQEKTDREKAIGSLTEDKNYIKKANNVSDNLVELDKQAKTNADAITETNQRTAGITRDDIRHETSIEGKVTVDTDGNIKAEGTITSNGLNAGDGDIKTNGKVSAGNVSTGTLETTGDAKIGGDLTVDGKLNVDKISMKNDELKNGKKHDSATTITADEISNLAKVTEQGNTTESQFTHNEKGTFNYAKDEKSTGEWKRATSNVTADGVSNKMTDSDGNTHTYYQTATESKEQLVNGDKSKSNFEKKTAEGNTISITEKDADGNLKSSLTNTQTVNGEKTSVTNEDSSSTINQGADQIRYNVTSKDENKTSSSIEVKADGITNTSKDGTITNTAKNVTNEGTESVTNKVGANEVKVSQNGVDIKAEAGKKITESVGTASRVVENDKITDNAGDSTVTTENGKGTTFGKEGSTGTTNIYGDSIKTGTINAEDTTTGKLTAGAAAGVDGGRLTVDADGVKGSYKSGDYTSRSYILPNTLKSGVDNGKEPTDAGFVGSRTDHYMDGNNAKLDETVKDDDGSNVTKKTSTGTVTTITDGTGTTTTTTEQGVKDITNTAKDGTITNDAMDIVNNAQETITNTAGTSITNQVKDSTVTTDANGTTFENKTAAVSDGGTTTTKINGNRINTGRVDANELGVSDVDGTNTADLSVKAGEDGGVKASAGNGTITGSLDVTAGEVGSSVTDASGKGSTFKQRIDAIMMESKNVSIKADETLTNEAKVITNKASEVINNEAININNTATGIITSKASEIKNQADKLISNKVGENTWENMENGKITTSIKDGAKQNLTQSDATGTTQSTVDGAKSTVTIQNADGLVGAVTDGTSTNASATTATSSAQTIMSGGKANSVITTIDGTQFVNSEAATPVTGASGAGTADRTTIKGNTITTGKVTMDYADVMKDLGVHGSAKVDNNLEVGGTSTLKGDVTMESNAKVGGTLDVTKRATFHDDVDIKKNLSVDGNANINGDVTARSYKVGDKTYIDANGINANDQKITNVADGSISEGSKDAVNGGQLYGVKTDLEHKVDKVGANAAAMANLHPMEFDPDSKWNIAAAMGNYGSETATAIGAFYRPNEDVMVNFSTAFGTGENMVGGGVSVRLGKGSNKLSREESNALKDQVNDLTARMDALLSVLNPNMSKEFPDVPENHWAYEAVSRLAGNDIVQGYPDGEFHGERTMTRYEMAEIIYNALSRGAEAERELVEEFKPELQAMAASEKATAERAEG